MMVNKEWKTDVIVTRGKIYTVCLKCERLIRLNKFILGDWHFCSPPEDK